MIKNYLLPVIIFSFLALFQQSFIGGFSSAGFGLGFYLIITFLFVFFAPLERALFYSLAAGLFLDIFSLEPFGLFSVAFAASALFLKKISLSFKKPGILIFIVSLVLFCLFFEALLFGERFLFYNIL